MIADFVKQIDFGEKLTKINNKVTSNDMRHVGAEKKLNDHITLYKKVINDLPGELKQMSAKGLTNDLINGYSILYGAKYFVEDGSQHCLVFQPVFEQFQNFTGTDKILVLNSKGLSKEIFKTPVTLGNSFASKSIFVHKGRVEAKYKGNWLIQDNISCTHRNVVNLCIVNELDTWSRDLNTDFTLGDYLFGVVKLTKNADPDKYGYIGYGIGFEVHSQFLSSNGELGKSDVIFGVDNSSSMHADNRKKRYLFLVKAQQMD